MDDELDPVAHPPPGQDPDGAVDAGFVHANLRRNTVASFAHGMLGMTGFRLIAAPTFVPSYIFMLTGSSFAVGLAQAVQQAGSVISPLRSASAIEDKLLILPYARRTGMAMRLPLVVIALLGWYMGIHSPSNWLLAAITIAALCVFGYFSGAQRVAFQMLMAKVIPLKVRGRLQGWRNFCGGAIAALLSWWAGSTLIQNNVLGNGYATTFAISFVLTSLGLTILVLMLREPESRMRRPTMLLRQRLRELPVLLENRDYKEFLRAQLVAMIGRTAIAFCILYAGDRMHLTGATLGLLSFAFLGADTVSNLAWGAIGDRKGFRLVLLLSLALWVVGYALVLVAASPAGFIAAFATLGAAISGYMIAAQTLVLEFGRHEDIPMRLALSATVETSVASIGPLVGGAVAALLGFRPLIEFSMAAMLVAVIIVWWRVGEPRHARGG